MSLYCADSLVIISRRWSLLGCEASQLLGAGASRPSARAFVARHPPGTAYVYFNYGMYWLLNVLVKGGTEDGFVLFRAIEPTRGVSAMQRRRVAHRKSPTRALKSTALCSGPGRLPRCSLS